jgi:hypothetical protein
VSVKLGFGAAALSNAPAQDAIHAYVSGSPSLSTATTLSAVV